VNVDQTPTTAVASNSWINAPVDWWFGESGTVHELGEVPGAGHARQGLNTLFMT
jgi:hypothetical protein